MFDKVWGFFLTFHFHFHFADTIWQLLTTDLSKEVFGF